VDTTLQLPDLGEGMQTARILNILVDVGQTVSEYDGLIELETDKVTLVMPSAVPGRVLAIYVQLGDEVAVGDPLLSIETGDGPARVKQLNRVVSIKVALNWISSLDADRVFVSRDDGGVDRVRHAPLLLAVQRVAGALRGIDLTACAEETVDELSDSIWSVWHLFSTAERSKSYSGSSEAATSGRKRIARHVERVGRDVVTRLFAAAQLAGKDIGANIELPRIPSSDCVLVYSRANRAVVCRLADVLQGLGLSFVTSEFGAGRAVSRSVSDGNIVVFASLEALANPYVERELERAVDGGRPLAVVLLDEAMLGHELAPMVAQRQMIDARKLGDSESYLQVGREIAEAVYGLVT
jgi:hypothetical protein